MKIIFTNHAEKMLKFRNIDKGKVIKCIEKPDNVSPARLGKKIFLKNYGKNYLKVIISNENESVVVITQYWLVNSRVKS